jgi:hypothetical protein
VASIAELKSRIDLHDLADKLGLSRPGDRGNYRSPHHDDKTPSLSVFDKNGTQGWKDHSSGKGGSCVDLVMDVLELDVAEAVVYLHELYNLPLDKPESNQPQQEKSRAEYISEKCFEQAEEPVRYLTGRGISEEVVRGAIKRRSVGWNNYTSTKIAPGQMFHGGPACAFIVKDMNTSRVVAVDLRYEDKDLNGGLKTQCQGEKYGYIWYDDLKAVQKAHTIYIVESPINALSVASAKLPKGTESIAVRGVNVKAIDWSFLAGKKVIICFDADLPNEKNERPGPEAGWALHEILLGLNVSAMMVDQLEWEENKWNDVNDIIVKDSVPACHSALRKLEPWIISGLPGKESAGRQRLYLPPHDHLQYFRYRAKEDFTTYVKSFERNEEGDKEEFSDVAGFRVAGISRVTIASATSTMTGEKDSQPTTTFAVSVQTPRHGYKLIRRVLEDEKLHNIDQWRKFGPVFNQAVFSRMINILERAAHLGSRNAANFVGLCWRDGKAIVNEGPDTYFTDPDKQCPYHNLTFPSGTLHEGRTVLAAYQNTFSSNAAAMMLIWGIGAHLKNLLGFWPHMTLQADKGAGKSTLIKRLERTIGFTMFSGQSLQTEFRLLTSISHTSHPVGWEELSARRQDVIDKAVAMLQENYQYTVSRRGADMTEYVLSAPVLLAGEDVPVRSLIGKLVRSELTGKKGAMMPEDLPRFPVKQWLQFLTTKSRQEISNIYKKARQYCLDNSRAKGDDDGAVRMAGNYAAVMTAWRLVCEFLDIPKDSGNFIPDCLTEMNSHVSETSTDREPWVWILETILSEMDSGNYRHPYKFDQVTLVPGENSVECLLIRTGHIMDHISHTPALREKWNALPVKSDRVFKRQCKQADVIYKDDVEKVIVGKRVCHMVAFSLEKLATYGLYTSSPEVAE